MNDVLWGYRDGEVLHLVADHTDIPEFAHARYSFKSSGELVFAAHYIPIVQTLAGKRVEGPAFTGHDGASEFLHLKRLRAAKEAA